MEYYLVGISVADDLGADNCYRLEFLTFDVCLCVCVLFVFFLFILDVKFVGCTSRGHTGGRSHMIFYPPSFCGACLYFSREKDSAVHFPRRP